nr:hypothetical protein [Mesorhizobium sp. L48C026A00]
MTLQRLYSADICEQFYEADRDAISLLPVFVGFAGSTETVRLNAEHNEFQWVPFDQAVTWFRLPGSGTCSGTSRKSSSSKSQIAGC